MKHYTITVRTDRDQVLFRTTAIAENRIFPDALGAFRLLQASGVFTVVVEETETTIEGGTCVVVKDVTAEWHKWLRAAQEMLRPASDHDDHEYHTDAEHLGAWKV